MTTRLVALLLFAIAGLMQPFLAASTGAGKSQATHLPPRYLSDAQLLSAIKTKLAKSKLKADHFTVTVVKGVTTFEGTTSIMQHKGAATRIAHTSGAVEVRNNIRISEEAKAKAVAGLTKARSTPVPATSPAKTAPPAPEPIPRAAVIFPPASQ